MSTGSAYVDANSLSGPTIRSSKCEFLISPDSKSTSCPLCCKLREVLRVKNWRLHVRERKAASAVSKTAPTSHVNYRYLTQTELIERMQQQHRLFRLTSRQLARLKCKVEEDCEQRGVTLDEEAHEDLCAILKGQNEKVMQSLSPDTFPHLFWKQQLQAASRKDSRGMRWHPLIIKWCLYLRHQSSGAYETLRNSGCIHLPSQRTLRDYTHYVHAAPGFSNEVDNMLKQAAEVDTCEDYEKCTLLLLDEMHIREGLVYDKHNGKLIGFADLGQIHEHLWKYEKSLLNESTSAQPLATTMMVFMVRGLFNKLQFAYAQFPCAKVSGDLLFHPFWEAVRRIERCNLKVSLHII